MEQWTREEKDQIISEIDERRLTLLHDKIKSSSWRTSYHIQTVTGLLNDPNAFSYYNGKWHLFYQWFPFGAVHGMKHWYHVTSEDLVHWKNEGLALKPDIKYDNFGCYSGSGFVKGSYLYMVYTGNHHNSYGSRVPYQLVAAMDDEGNFVKYSHPLIEPEEGYTEHQRDPKIFMEDGQYYILLGVQNEKKEGRMLLYQSSQIALGWKLKGELKIEGYDSFGYMVECPCIEKIGDKWLLLFSPQGMKPDGDHYRNAYANVYMIGDLDFETCTFIPDGPIQELDHGFDFYASQTAHQTLSDTTAYLIGWFGCSDYTYPPTDEEGWAGLLSLPRELTIEDGKLMQRPVKELESILGDVVFEAINGEITTNKLLGRTPVNCMIHLENTDGTDVKLNLFSTNRHRGFEIAYDAEKQMLRIDRSEMMHQVNTDFGTDRKVYLPEGLRTLDIYVDHSAVEIFINDGEAVMSSRIFPTPEEHFIRMSGKNINMMIYRTKMAVKDNAVFFPPVEVKE